MYFDARGKYRWDSTDYMFFTFIGILISSMIVGPAIIFAVDHNQRMENAEIQQKNMKVAEQKAEDFGIGEIVEIYDRDMVVLENRQSDRVKVWIGRKNIPLRGEYWSVTAWESGSTGTCLYLDKNVVENSEEQELAGDADLEKLKELRQVLLDMHSKE